MDIEFQRPELLGAAALAAVAVVVLGVVGRRGFPSVGRLVAATAVRALVLLLLGSALAGPYLPHSTETPVDSVYVVDRSASVSPAGRNRQGTQFADLAREGPSRELPFGDDRESDARPALLRAAADAAERVVISTDGHLTADAADLVADLTGAGRTAGVLPVPAPADDAPAVTPETESPPPAPAPSPNTVST